MQTRDFTQETVFAAIKEAVIAQTGFDGALLAETHIEEDLGMDSLERVDLVLRLEREFGVSLATQEVQRCATLQDLTNLILKQVRREDS